MAWRLHVVHNYQSLSKLARRVGALCFIYEDNDCAKLNALLNHSALTKPFNLTMHFKTRIFLQTVVLIATVLASAAASLVMMHFSCYATMCSEEYFSYETRLHVIIYYGFLSLTLCLFSLHACSYAFRSFTGFQLLANVPILGERLTLGGFLLCIWISIIAFGPIIYWFPTQWEFWGDRADPLDWMSAKIQLTITGVSGHSADVLLGLLIIPVSRNSLVGQAFSLHHSTLILAHRLVSYLFSIAVAAHGITYIVSYQYGYGYFLSRYVLMRSRSTLQMVVVKATRPRKRPLRPEIQQ